MEMETITAPLQTIKHSIFYIIMSYMYQCIYIQLALYISLIADHDMHIYIWLLPTAMCLYDILFAIA